MATRGFYLFLLLCFAWPVLAAEPTPDLLKDISIDPHLGQTLPLERKFKNEVGAEVDLKGFFDGRKPVILIMSYYGCPMLCGIILNAAREGMEQLDWIPGKQFSVVTISIDPKEDFPLAAEKKKNIVEAMPAGAKREAFRENWHFLTGSAENSRAVADALGFRYKWVAEEKQFAHGAAIFLVSPQGKLTRALFGTTFSPRDLKLGLLEASEGKVGTITEKILLFCYHYDPKDNQYALFATRIMRVGAAITVAVILGMYGLLYLRRKQGRGVG